MQHSSLNNENTDHTPLSNDSGSVDLHVELLRLQRENRTLSIALREMERVAERDMLTPLYNRRYFLSALHQRIAHVAKTNDRIALIYADVDGLKAINDQYGHYAGDIALIEIAARLAATMRKGDVLARIGGDEFGILLDKVNISEAKAMVRRLKGTIEDSPLDFDGSSLPLSAAFGLTMLDPGKSAEELMGSADSAMYGAKRAA
ncbi:MAG: GGDEF domain-containing protein [Sphingopyxis sp.]